jgi:ribosomal protein S18 acetylase RimI-like enzyme
VARFRVAADAAGAPVGCVFLKPVRADACEIKRLSVDPASRGLGLGRRLMTSALEEARRLGARCVLLDTGVYDKAAHNLYDKLGFRRIPRYPESENDAALEPYLIYMRREL